jgi:energy-coupling factor transporter ATP-binding protein EcfA2
MACREESRVGAVFNDNPPLVVPVTALLVERDIQRSLKAAHKVYIMQSGRIRLEGRPGVVHPYRPQRPATGRPGSSGISHLNHPLVSRMQEILPGSRGFEIIFFQEGR